MFYRMLALFYFFNVDFFKSSLLSVKGNNKMIEGCSKKLTVDVDLNALLKLLTRVLAR